MQSGEIWLTLNVFSVLQHSFQYLCIFKALSRVEDTGGKAVVLAETSLRDTKKLYETREGTVQKKLLILATDGLEKETQDNIRYFLWNNLGGAKRRTASKKDVPPAKRRRVGSKSSGRRQSDRNRRPEWVKKQRKILLMFSNLRLFVS